MRSARAIAAAIVATAPIALALVGGSPALAQKMYGDYGWITCTNTDGERCDSGFMKTTGAANKNHKLILTASPEHCSKIVFIVLANGGFEQRTRALGPGESAAMDLNLPVDAVLITAEGLAGGCNSGHLTAWGVKAVVTDRFQ